MLNLLVCASITSKDFSINIYCCVLSNFVLGVELFLWSGEDVGDNSTFFFRNATSFNGNINISNFFKYNSTFSSNETIPQFVMPTRSSYQVWLIRHIKRQVEFEYILRGIALAFAFLSLILLVSLRLKSSLKFFIHRQMLTAYCISDCLFLLTHIDVQLVAVKNEHVCAAMSIFSHYFMTTFFTCMLIEGLHICVKVTTVFDTESKTKQYLLYGAIGWGFPLVIIIIELVGWFDKFAATDTCSLLTNKDQWLYKGPVAAILLANFACFIFILAVVIREIIASKKYSNGLKKMAGTIRSVLVIHPLLGITFLMGFFLEFDDVVLGYVFVVFNSILGILFFVFHVVFDAQVRKSFLKDVFGNVAFGNAAHSTGTMRSARSSYSPTLGEDRRQSTNFDGISQKELFGTSSHFGLSPNSCRRVHLAVWHTDSTELGDLGMRNSGGDSSSLSSN